MYSDIVFLDRRSKQDRRVEDDPCKDAPLDLHHCMRRNSTDRRSSSKSLVEDYVDFLESHSRRIALAEIDRPVN